MTAAACKHFAVTMVFVTTVSIIGVAQQSQLTPPTPAEEAAGWKAMLEAAGLVGLTDDQYSKVRRFVLNAIDQTKNDMAKKVEIAEITSLAMARQLTASKSADSYLLHHGYMLRYVTTGSLKGQPIIIIGGVNEVRYYTDDLPFNVTRTLERLPAGLYYVKPALFSGISELIDQHGEAHEFESYLTTWYRYPPITKSSQPGPTWR